MSAPLITVYITNYNYGKYIRQAIESVLAQSEQNFELIIIDDGSTDDSKEIIEEYREREQITIIYQKNKGLNITNNVAMRVSSGKYLMRLDADDYLAPEALAEMSALLEANDALGLVFPDYYYVDAEGQITGQEQRHNFEKEVSLYDQPAHGACTMIRLSFLKKLGGYNESFTCQDGYDLWMKFVIHYSVRNINKPLFYYRRHGENLTRNEERILQTRRAIKKTFLEIDHGQNAALMVIPVRNTEVAGQSLPLMAWGDGETLLSRKVEECLKAECCAGVRIISSHPEILAYAREHFTGNERVEALDRPQRLAGPNQSLSATVKLAVEAALSEGLKFQQVMTVALDFPYLRAEVMDEAVNTLLLFESDAVLSVRPDNKTYYRHTGHTLAPILDQEKFTRIEREALYRAAGGVMVSSYDSFRKNAKINAGQISHVIVDEKMAFGIFSEFELMLFQAAEGLKPG